MEVAGLWPGTSSAHLARSRLTYRGCARGMQLEPTRGQPNLLGTAHPVVTPKFLLIKIPGIFGVDQSKFNRKNRCRRTGASRPRCAAQIPDRSTGTVDVYTQHASPPKASGRTTRPRCGLGRPSRLAGNCIFFSRVTSTPHPASSIRSHGRCALEIDFWLVQYARFASGAWLAPFQR